MILDRESHISPGLTVRRQKLQRRAPRSLAEIVDPLARLSVDTLIQSQELAQLFPDASVPVLLSPAHVARPLRVHIPDAIYHVMSRGNAKQRIFTSDTHAQRFLVLLASVATRFGVLCHCFCLMPNHFHLLLRPGAQPIARMMQQLNSAYCQFFNRDSGQVGHVLQGRYKALLVDRETYFLQVVRYIVLNPVRAGLVVDPARWKWSSYRALAGLEDCGSVLDPATVWRTFDEGDIRAAQAKFVDFVGQGDPEPPSDPVFIGSDDLAAQVADMIRPQQAEREFTYAERFAGRPSLAKLFENGIEIRSLDASMREAFWRYAYTLNEIGAFLGCHPSTVAKRIRRRESDRVGDTVSGLGAPVQVLQCDRRSTIKI